MNHLHLRIGLFIDANLSGRPRHGVRWMAPILLGVVLCSHAAFAAEPCTPVLARLVSLQGNVELWRPQPGQWQAAGSGMALCAQDVVRVGASSRAALLLPNETMLRLNQKTTVMISSLEDRQHALIDLLLGAIHVITRTPQPFRVKTPFVNANIEGTEFAISLDAGAATIAVVEGRVALDNPYGRIVLGGGEAGVAATGQAPKKTSRSGRLTRSSGRCITRPYWIAGPTCKRLPTPAPMTNPMPTGASSRPANCSLSVATTRPGANSTACCPPIHSTVVPTP